MANSTNKTLLILAVATFGLFIGIFFFNRWLTSEIQKPVAQAPVVNQPVVPDPAKKVKKHFAKVIRKAKLDPSREYTLSLIYADDKEVARYKVNQMGELFDLQGEIPDGKVVFTNETTRTNGEEKYQNNKRHGDYVEYYEAGSVKIKAQYLRGEILNRDEYFIDGTLKMTEDYQDALRFSEHRETGDGKVFRRDGSLMYQWHLTNTDESRFTKSFNQAGQLVEVRTFDELGRMVDKKHFTFE